MSIIPSTSDVTNYIGSGISSPSPLATNSFSPSAPNNVMPQMGHFQGPGTMPAGWVQPQTNTGQPPLGSVPQGWVQPHQGMSNGGTKPQQPPIPGQVMNRSYGPTPGQSPNPGMMSGIFGR